MPDSVQQNQVGLCSISDVFNIIKMDQLLSISLLL